MHVNALRRLLLVELSPRLLHALHAAAYAPPSYDRGAWPCAHRLAWPQHGALQQLPEMRQPDAGEHLEAHADGRQLATARRDRRVALWSRRRRRWLPLAPCPCAMDREAWPRWADDGSWVNVTREEWLLPDRADTGLYKCRYMSRSRSTVAGTGPVNQTNKQTNRSGLDIKPYVRLRIVRVTPCRRAKAL